MSPRIVLSLLLLLPATTFAIDGKSEELQLDDGVVLAANYYGGNNPGPGLLFLNMCNPDRDQSEWTGVAQKLSDHGYHILTFDYRGFGTSGGTMPENLDTVDVAMEYWRRHWMDDVQAAYEQLVSHAAVDQKNVGIAGASCGVFMGLEFTLANPNVRTFVSLGGPTQKRQRISLSEREDLPVLLISGNEGPARDWTETLFTATAHEASRAFLYNAVTYATKIFQYDNATEDIVVNWFRQYLPRE